MAPGRDSQEGGVSLFKFWSLFIVGLVVVLSLFRGFMGGVENAKLREAELKAKGIGTRKRRGRSSRKEKDDKTLKHEHED